MFDFVRGGEVKHFEVNACITERNFRGKLLEVQRVQPSVSADL